MGFEFQRSVFQEEHEAFRRSVRSFLEAEVVPQYSKWENDGFTPREIWLRAGDVGLLGTSISEDYGGAGGDFRFDAVVLEELGRLTLAAPAWDMHSYIIAPFLTHFGTKEQKQRWLPRMAGGEVISAIGLTEPNAGSDLAGIRTHAKRDGNGYRINGSKIFITNGIIADVVLLAAKTAPELGAKGMSIFLVDTKTPGFRRGRKLKKVGNHAQDTAELFFDDMHVPADAQPSKLLSIMFGTGSLSASRSRRSRIHASSSQKWKLTSMWDSPSSICASKVLLTAGCLRKWRRRPNSGPPNSPIACSMNASSFTAATAICGSIRLRAPGPMRVCIVSTPALTR
jgi:alkylation response protein AidB-like acyl-CoA dehydrogenase